MKNYSIVKLEIALKMFSSSITSELRNDARRLAQIKEDFIKLKVDGKDGSKSSNCRE